MDNIDYYGNDYNNSDIGNIFEENDNGENGENDNDNDRLSDIPSLNKDNNYYDDFHSNVSSVENSNYTDQLQDEINYLNIIDNALLKPSSMRQLKPYLKSKKKNCKKVIDYYERYYDEKPYEVTVHSGNFKCKMIYTSITGSRISKGTCFRTERIFNFYKTQIGDAVSYRFGVNVNNPPKDVFNDLSNIIYQNEKNNKIIVCLSLIGYCTSFKCRVISKAVPDLKNEDLIAKLEKNSQSDTFIPVFLPVRPPVLKGIRLNPSDINKRLNTHIDIRPVVEKIMNLSRNINLENPKNFFESLVEIFKICYLHKDKIIICYHCKSGKDRTGIIDAIQKSTCFYIQKNKDNLKSFNLTDSDYENIRELVPYFLLMSLKIVYYSIGIFGIKLNHITLARWIFRDKASIFRMFKGPF